MIANTGFQHPLPCSLRRQSELDSDSSRSITCVCRFAVCALGSQSILSFNTLPSRGIAVGVFLSSVSMSRLCVFELSFNPTVLRLLCSHPAVHCCASRRPIAFHIPPPSQDPEDPGCMAAGRCHGVGVTRSAAFGTSAI